MKILVTGALGHIGSRLIRYLPEAFLGAEIVMVDNLSTQRYPSLFQLPKTGKYRFKEADITKTDISDLVAGCDAVIHLAAITNAAASFDIEAQLKAHNYGATQKVAEACLKEGVPLLFASTTSVYGTANDQVDEACGPSELRPQSPYAECKLQEEALLQAMGKKGLRFVICRLGTIFGVSVGMRFHTAVNKFCWQAVMGEPLTVWKTALHQKRPYLDLEDAVRAMALVVKKDHFSNEVFNVLTVNETVDGILDAIRAHIPELSVKLVEERIMNQLSYEVLDKKFRALGFRPQGSVASGVAGTIASFQALLPDGIEPRLSALLG